MPVRVSPISRTAAILILAIGVFDLVAGLSTNSLANVVAGSAFIVLGLALLGLLRWFTLKLRRELREAAGQAAG